MTPELLMRHQPVDHVERVLVKRRDALSRAMCITLTAMIVLFAVKDLYLGKVGVSIILLLFAFSNCIALLIYSQLKLIEVFTSYMFFSCAALCFYLVSTGGTDRSGIIWLPVMPVLMFSIMKVRVALVAMVAVFVLMSLLLYVPGLPFYTANYTDYVKFVGLAAYFLVMSFTYYEANVRERSTAAVSQLNNELSQIASTDELTLLPNRRSLSNRLNFESQRAKRNGEHFSIILCDIDYFKKINDNFGHNTGDRALQAFSKTIQSQFRSTDFIGRWGGEEFLAILPNTPQEEAVRLANIVRQSVCKSSLLPQMPNRLVTMSAGVASSADSLEPEKLIALADRNLYQAKNDGRNRVMPEEIAA